MTKYLLLLLLAFPVFAAEKHYNESWCPGEVEVTLFDGSRVDCLTQTEAIEVDYAYNWAESIGQALLYANLTGKKPAVLLLVKPNDSRFVARFSNATRKLNIQLYIKEIEK